MSVEDDFEEWCNSTTWFQLLSFYVGVASIAVGTGVMFGEGLGLLCSAMGVLGG